MTTSHFIPSLIHELECLIQLNPNVLTRSEIDAINSVESKAFDNMRVIKHSIKQFNVTEEAKLNDMNTAIELLDDLAYLAGNVRRFNSAVDITGQAHNGLEIHNRRTWFLKRLAKIDEGFTTLGVK